MNEFAPSTLSELQDGIRASSRVAICGNRTKSGMHLESCETLVSLRNYSTVVEYEPTEFTVTVKAGMPIKSLLDELFVNGQYFPFDPMLVQQGATIGGTIAAGINGPGRWRHGGIRDFVLGVQLIDGRGVALRGGGKVVKNAAGFDLPKLLVGSCGWLGAITEVTLKVFPAAKTSLTLLARQGSCSSAADVIAKVTRLPYDLDAVEIAVLEQETVEVLFRLVGEENAITSHAERLKKSIGREVESVDRDVAEQRWHRIARFEDLGTNRLIIKQPCTLRDLATIERNVGTVASQSEGSVTRRYGAAGNVAWLAFSCYQTLHDYLRLENGRPWQLVMKPTELDWPANAPCGYLPPGSRRFAERVKQTFDAETRFVSCLDAVTWEEVSSTESSK